MATKKPSIVKPINKEIRPSVNLERQTIITKHEFIDIEFSGSLRSIVKAIQEECDDEDPTLYCDPIGHNGAVEIGWVGERQESDREYDNRLNTERRDQQNFDKRKDNEVRKAREILNKYGETL
jgi:hypothetical protein